MLPVLLGHKHGPINPGFEYEDSKKTLQDGNKADGAHGAAREAAAAWSRIRNGNAASEEFAKGNEVMVGEICRSMSAALLSSPEDAPETRDLLRRTPEVLRAMQKYIFLAKGEEEARVRASCKDGTGTDSTCGGSISSATGSDTEDESQSLLADSSTPPSRDVSRQFAEFYYIGDSKPPVQDEACETTGRAVLQRCASTSMVERFPQMLNPVLKSRVNSRLHGSVLTESRGGRTSRGHSRASSPLPLHASPSFTQLERFR